MNCRLLSGVFVLLFGAGLTAQQQAPVHKAVTPKYAGTYKMATGEFIPGAGAQRSGPVTIFNNTTPTNYYSVPGSNQEWIDEGILNKRTATPGLQAAVEQINGFEVIYCSTDPAASGTIIYTFYDETVECTGPTGGVPGQPNCAYALSGLPMGTPTGGIQCWIVTVDLEGGLECPNNAAETFRTTEQHTANPLFGWGILPQLDNTGPWLRKGGKGTTNDFVWYDRNAGTNVGCFWFGGVPFASFSMKMFGENANAHNIVDTDANPANGRWGSNPLDTLSLNSNGPDLVRGQLANFSVSPVVAGRTHVLVYSINQTQLANVIGAGGQRFTALVPLANAANQNFPMPGGTLITTLPANLPIARYYIQVFALVGGTGAGNVVAVSFMICIPCS